MLVSFGKSSTHNTCRILVQQVFGYLIKDFMCRLHPFCKKGQRFALTHRYRQTVPSSSSNSKRTHLHIDTHVYFSMKKKKIFACDQRRDHHKNLSNCKRDFSLFLFCCCSRRGLLRWYLQREEFTFYHYISRSLSLHKMVEVTMSSEDRLKENLILKYKLRLNEKEEEEFHLRCASTISTSCHFCVDK